jgi:predicted N-acyltransferase
MITALSDPAVVPGAKGWLKATPLEKYSSLHELSLTGLIGLDRFLPDKKFYVQFDFNLHTPFHPLPEAYLIFQTQDADKAPKQANSCYSITDFNRWRMDISSYNSFQNYLDSLIRWHRCNFNKSEKNFAAAGCTVSMIKGDWSQYVDAVYGLYANVARKHNDKLYDLHFFRMLAKREDSQLLCAWLNGNMIGMFVLIEELPTLHSICCGLDYEHTSESYAYSWLNYELVRLAIESQKYQFVDVGMTADDSKKLIGFSPIPSRMDLYTNGVITRGVLRIAHALTTARITPDAKIKFNLRRNE